MERVVEFLKDAEVFYFKNATATFSAFTHEPEVVKLGQKLWMINVGKIIDIQYIK